MEERIGEIWHRLVTRASRHDFPDAVVQFNDVQREVGILFRALGGDGGLRVVAGTARSHGARRSWLQRLAGSGERTEVACRDGETLQLPASLALFSDSSLNRDLYLWLAALAARASPVAHRDWLLVNQTLTSKLITDLPGLASRYNRLVQAHLAVRPDPARLPAAEAAVEVAICQALIKPGSVDSMPSASCPPAPVPLWLYSALASTTDRAVDDESPDGGGSQSQNSADNRRRRAERVDDPDENRGLIFSRFETIMSWAEYVKVDRSTDDSDDDSAERAAEDLNVISVSRGGVTSGAKLRFDLDLPAADNDDLILGPGLRLPEWDYRNCQLKPDHCLLLPMVARDAVDSVLPVELRAPSARLRRRFELLAAAPHWRRGEYDGQELDLDACLRHRADALRGTIDSYPPVYRAMRRDGRELATLLLADLSLSTDAWLNDRVRIIDVIRDSLLLFAESLHATRDRFSIYGFSSRRRNHVRYHTLKEFSETYGNKARGRLLAIKPGYYTRMGAAIRQATLQLGRETAERRLLLILTDGKPNDLDIYEGRYGVEDTRKAILEARQAGLQPFCVTIDERAHDYLPYIFGSNAYALIKNPAELPHKLPLLYAQLTR